MIIKIKKFGATLVSRQMGKEAFLAFQPALQKVKTNEKVGVDFEGVRTFSPSWGDEFLTPLLKMFGKRLSFKNTQNLSVKATLKFLEDTHKINFVYK